MSLADDLLSQANRLAAASTGRPRQADLRRAVSASYYALFHLLIGDAVQRLIPSRPPALRNRAARAYSHSEMKQVCSAFKRQPLTEPLFALIGASATGELRSLATTFIELQEARHTADYDIGATLSRAYTLAMLGKAKSAFQSWRAINTTDEANVFLAALAHGARWNK